MDASWIRVCGYGNMSGKASSKIAIVGARGIANYGGFETVVAELAPRLHDLGYEVYCSHRLQADGENPARTRGVNLLYFPLRFPRGNILGRIFDVLYDWYFTAKCAFLTRCDTVYCLGLGAGLSLPIARLSKASIVVNVDGLEWSREKFSFAERAYLRLSYLFSCIWADKIVIDNGSLRDFVPAKNRAKAVHIPYGVLPIECPVWNPDAAGVNGRGGGAKVAAGEYLLVVARLEPENNIATVVEAYSRSRVTMPLVIVGNFASRGYEASVRNVVADLGADKSVIMLGAIYDRKVLEMLRCHCRAYIHGHSVGGTNPSLLEAMAAGNLILAHDNVFNREVCGDGGLYFRDAVELAQHLDGLDHVSAETENLRKTALNDSRTRFGWDDVVGKYDELFRSL